MLLRIFVPIFRALFYTRISLVIFHPTFILIIYLFLVILIELINTRNILDYRLLGYYNILCNTINCIFNPTLPILLFIQCSFIHDIFIFSQWLLFTFLRSIFYRTILNLSLFLFILFILYCQSLFIIFGNFLLLLTYTLLKWLKILIIFIIIILFSWLC